MKEGEKMRREGSEEGREGTYIVRRIVSVSRLKLLCQHSFMHCVNTQLCYNYSTPTLGINSRPSMTVAVRS